MTCVLNVEQKQQLQRLLTILPNVKQLQSNTNSTLDQAFFDRLRTDLTGIEICHSQANRLNNLQFVERMQLTRIKMNQVAAVRALLDWHFTANANSRLPFFAKIEHLEVANNDRANPTNLCLWLANNDRYYQTNRPSAGRSSRPAALKAFWNELRRQQQQNNNNNDDDDA